MFSKTFCLNSLVLANFKRIINFFNSSLKEADWEIGKLESISFPAISSGIFGFPKDLCAKIFFDTIKT